MISVTTDISRALKPVTDLMNGLDGNNLRQGMALAAQEHIVEPIKSRAKVLGILDTGLLIHSVRIGSSGSDANSAFVEVGDYVPYAQWNEFGAPSRNMAARPYFYPTVRENLDNFIIAVGKFVYSLRNQGTFNFFGGNE